VAAEKATFSVALPEPAEISDMSDNPPASPPPIPRRSPGASRFAVACAVFVVCSPALIPGFYLFEKYRGKRAWGTYQKEAKQRGVKLDLAEYVPPKVPDAENFASIPIFEAAFRASDEGYQLPDPFKLPKRKSGEMPQLNNPNNQTTIDLAAWQKYFVEVKLISSASENAASDVLKALEHYAEPLEQLRLAGTRQKCRFPVHWEKGFAAALPHPQILQNASKLYALRMAAHLTLGSSAAAYEDFREGLRLVMATRREPTVVAGLVRISQTVVMINGVWGGLKMHQWKDADLEKIERDLSKLDWLDDYVFSMGSERGEANSIVEMIIQQPYALDKLSLENEESIHKFLSYYPVGWLYQNQVRVNRFFDERIARVDPAQRRLFVDRQIRSSPENLHYTWQKLQSFVFVVITVVLEKSEDKFAQAASVTDEARLGCALERFRLSRGSFPKSLTDLTPEFIPSVPLEVVNGQPYHYHRPDDGNFVLYSVGMDLHDDGGVIDPKLPNSKQRDWVWRYPAK
jgi:hypothetical protein